MFISHSFLYVISYYRYHSIALDLSFYLMYNVLKCRDINRTVNMRLFTPKSPLEPEVVNSFSSVFPTPQVIPVSNFTPVSLLVFIL